MKILHTSDWHLGKRLEGKSRLQEQESALYALERTAAENKADVVVVAGDIFDTVNPPAEAESLFYNACLQIGKHCPVIAVAGNHDNPERLRAPEGIARACGILLCGNLDYAAAPAPFTGGEGWVRWQKGSECVNFALLPYPSSARMSQLGYVPDPEKSYADNVRQWFSICARGFTASGCNIAVSHLFMAGSTRTGDEAELGTAALLSPDVLPPCSYVALGHVHKPQCVSKSRNIYYSGSLLRYSFDDTSDKFFNLVDVSPAGVRVEQIPVGAGKPLVPVTADGFEACGEALQTHAGAYVRLLYNSPQPLSAAKYAELRGFDSFTSLQNVYVQLKTPRASVKMRSDAELFCAYYESQTGERPSDALQEMFAKAMQGEAL